MTKLLIKTNNDKTVQISNWIIENFPDDYINMRYLEPFVGNGSVLLNKFKSIEEVVCDFDSNIVKLWRAVRDENKNIRNKLLKLNYNQKTYEAIKNKKIDNDYFKEALSYFIISKMGGNKFNKIDRKKAYKFWKESAENISSVEERIKEVYFLYKTPFELIEKFDNNLTLCFCSPPFYDEQKKLEMKTDEYILLCDLLLSFRGKVVLYANNCAFFRRLFKDWKNIKLKGKNNCLWVNY
jgi:site-specific DNA-adenine methylase